MSDLSSINNVTDLLEYNKKSKNKLETALNAAFDLESGEAKTLVVAVLAQFSQYHQHVINLAINDKDIEQAGIWSYDKAMIDQAIQMVESVELGE